jgi:hypothetical protein
MKTFLEWLKSESLSRASAMKKQWLQGNAPQRFYGTKNNKEFWDRHDSAANIRWPFSMRRHPEQPTQPESPEKSPYSFSDPYIVFMTLFNNSPTSNSFKVAIMHNGLYQEVKPLVINLKKLPENLQTFFLKALEKRKEDTLSIAKILKSPEKIAAQIRAWANEMA